MVSASQIHVPNSAEYSFPVGWHLRPPMQPLVPYFPEDSYDIPPDFAREGVRMHSHTLTIVHTRVYVSHAPCFLKLRVSMSQFTAALNLQAFGRRMWKEKLF